MLAISEVPLGRTQPNLKHQNCCFHQMQPNGSAVSYTRGSSGEERAGARQAATVRTVNQVRKSIMGSKKRKVLARLCTALPMLLELTICNASDGLHLNPNFSVFARRRPPKCNLSLPGRYRARH